MKPAAAVGAGVSAFNAGRAIEAAGFFDLALAAAPGNHAVRLLLVHALRAAGRKARALAEARALCRRRPQERRFRLALLGLLNDSPRAGEGLSEALRGLSRDPSLWAAAEVKRALGRAVSAAARSAGAARALERRCAAALRRAPSSEGSLLLARLQQASGRRGAARRTLLQGAGGSRGEGRAALTRALVEEAGALARSAAAGRRDALRLLRALDLSGSPAGGVVTAGALAGALGDRALALRLLRQARPQNAAERDALARALADAGRPADALAAAADPRLAARLCLLLGRHERALKAYGSIAPRQRTGEDLLGAAEALERLGRHGEAARRRAAALALLRRRARSAPREAGARLALARALAAVERHEEAERAYSDALRLEPGLSDAWRERAHALDRLGRPAQAAACLERFAQSRGWTAELRLRAALSLVAADRPREALAHCAAARAAQGATPAERRARCAALQALGLRSRVLRAAGEEEPSRARSVYEGLGRFDLALRAAQAAARRPSASAGDFLELSRLSAWHGEAAPALAAALRARAAAPSCAAAWRALGAAQALAGRPRPALTSLDRALALDPGDAEALVWRAETLRKLGQARRSVREFSRLRLLVPTEAIPAAAWANQVLARSTYEEVGPGDPAWPPLFELVPWRQLGIGDHRSLPGLERLLFALRGNRSLTPTYLWEAALSGRTRLRLPLRSETFELQAALRFGDAAAVLREFDLIVKEDPRDPYSLASRGETLLWLGRGEQAARDFRGALRLASNLTWPRIGLAVAAMLGGDDRGASRAIESAVQAGAYQRFYATVQGELHRRAGRPEEALASFALVDDRPPYRPTLWLNVGLAQWESGRKSAFSRTYAMLARHVPELLAAASPGWRVPSARVLARALELCRGNRSSWMHTFFDGEGRLRHLKLRGLSAEDAPPRLKPFPWAFAAP